MTKKKPSSTVNKSEKKKKKIDVYKNVFEHSVS